MVTMKMLQRTSTPPAAAPGVTRSCRNAAPSSTATSGSTSAIDSNAVADMRSSSQ